MTVKDLRTLIDNLDEYIRIPGGIERLKKTVLSLAVAGQLTSQDSTESDADELYQQIQTDKQELILAGKLKSQRSTLQVDDSDVPFDTPKSWKWVRLDDVTRLITDGTHHTPRYKSTGVPFLSIKDISAGSLDFSHCKYLSYEQHLEINQRCNPEYGDILFCRIGTLGRPVIVDTEKPFSIFVSLGLIKFNQDLLMPKYLKLYLEAPQTYKQYSQIMAGGSHTNKLNLVSMRNLLTVLPPRMEQARIVEKVDAIFELIDELAIKYVEEGNTRKDLMKTLLGPSLLNKNSSKALKLLPELIRTKEDIQWVRNFIIHQAVSGKLVLQNVHDETAEDLYQRILQERTKELPKRGLRSLMNVSSKEEDYELPENWKWVQLGDVTNYGKTDKCKPSDLTSDTWVLELEDIEKTTSRLVSKIMAKTRHPSSDKNIFRKGDVLYGKLRPYLDKVIVADSDGVCSSEILPIRSYGNAIHPEYLLLIMKSPNFITTVNEMTYGVKMPRLGTEDGRRMLIPLAPYNEQIRIADKVSHLLKLASELESIFESPRVALSLASTVKAAELTNQQKKVQRKMLASFIANESLGGAQFGKTKFEKLLHLIEYHVLKKDLNQKYSVQPAGPYDGGFTRLFWDDVVKSKWFKVEDHGNLQKIVAGDKHEKSQKDYGYLSDDEKNKIRDLIMLFKDWGYGEAEIISTLYAAWNNRLIKGEDVSDDLLKQDFLQWDPQKTQYSDRLDRALAWMRQNNIVPDGWGNEIKRAKSSIKVSH